jgi:hypothetical protein
MTAQHNEAQPEVQSGTPDTIAGTDPIGPMMLPRRSKVGARAMALVGTVGMSAFAVTMMTNGGSTFTTIIEHGN